MKRAFTYDTTLAEYGFQKAVWASLECKNKNNCSVHLALPKGTNLTNSQIKILASLQNLDINIRFISFKEFNYELKMEQTRYFAEIDRKNVTMDDQGIHMFDCDQITFYKGEKSLSINHPNVKSVNLSLEELEKWNAAYANESDTIPTVNLLNLKRIFFDEVLNQVVPLKCHCLSQEIHKIHRQLGGLCEE